MFFLHWEYAVHDFDAQLAIGHAGEQFVARWLSRRGRDCRYAERIDQRRGIDLFVDDIAVEVKTDLRCAETGNVFIETTSVDIHNVPGWAVTSEAIWLFFLLPPTEMLIIETRRLREQIKYWKTRFRETVSQNRSYRTLGLLVPRAEIAALAARVYTLESSDDILGSRPSAQNRRGLCARVRR